MNSVSITLFKNSAIGLARAILKPNLKKKPKPFLANPYYGAWPHLWFLAESTAGFKLANRNATTRLNENTPLDASPVGNSDDDGDDSRYPSYLDGQVNPILPGTGAPRFH